MRRNTVVFGVTWLAFASLAAGQITEQPPKPGNADVQAVGSLKQYRAAKPSYDEALKRFAKKDYEGARRELAVAIERLPNYSAAHLLLAKTHYVTKEYPAALASVERAEQGWKAFSGLAADIHSDQQDAVYRQRRALNERLIQLRGELSNAQPSPERDRIVDQINQLERDLAELDRHQTPVPAAVAGVPAEYSFVHGNILLRMNQLAEAEEQYRRAIAANPKYGEAVNNLASLYYQAGKMQSALTVLEEAEQRGLPINADLKKAVMEAM